MAVPKSHPTLGNDLQAVAGTPPAQDPAEAMDMPFTEFFQMVGGDKAKAEEVLPGITSPEGLKMLQQGADGRPYVKVPAKAAARMQGNFKLPGSAPTEEWIDPDTLAQTYGFQSFQQMPPTLVMQLFPGIETPNGRMAWVRGKPDGSSMLRNPNTEIFRRMQADILTRMRDQAREAQASDMEP